jgi:uncharacterized integral membrane protein
MTEASGNGPWGGAGEGRSSVDKGRATRLAVAGIAILVAVVFIAQNNDRVELNFLVLSVTTRVWVGLLVSLALGALLGQGAEALWARRRSRRAGS